MDLVPYIYHEQQEQGSMLCAQHCLNNLLQQNLYSAADLGDIASELDVKENAELDANQRAAQSHNVNTSGFFSVAVLESAMRVFDLELVRWKSEEMKPFHDKPEDQSAFIMHLQQHWLPLRRFSGSPDRWYNVNSLLANPEWISPSYLKLALQSAEEEGHSVFVVRKLGSRQAQPSTISILPECQADLVGLQPPEALSSRRNKHDGSVQASSRALAGELQRFQQEQLEALSTPVRSRRRNMVQKELASHIGVTRPTPPKNRFQQMKEEEDANLAAAIEASLAESAGQGQSSEQGVSEGEMNSDPQGASLIHSLIEQRDETIVLPSDQLEDSKSGFISGVVSSIFEPGVNQPLFQAMNISFFLLILSLLFLGYMTFWNKHVLFLMLVSTGLWMTMIWFVQEITKVQQQQQNAPPAAIIDTIDESNVDVPTETKKEQ